MSAGLRVGVLVSGAGTNLQALLDRVHGKEGVGIAAVASSAPEAAALERARAAGVPAEAFALDRYPDRAARDTAIGEFLDVHGVRLVVLAGYMQLLTAAFLERYPEAIVNVHPALLPAFPGVRAVEQAVDHGVKVFGVTVHFVDDGIDSGPIILQRAVELGTQTDPEVVRDALRPLEHQLLPEAVSLFARGFLRFDPDNSRRVLIGGEPDEGDEA
jgi:phosphoribosylglycinamide formyltransferase-1